MWEIEFFEKPNGRCPVQEFLDDLNPTSEYPYVENAINQLAEHGPNLRRPQVDFLRDHIYELRVRLGKQQARILYFFFMGEKIILTNGFIKPGGPVPEVEIRRAIEYRREYLGRERRTMR